MAWYARMGRRTDRANVLTSSGLADLIKFNLAEPGSAEKGRPPLGSLRPRSARVPMRLARALARAAVLTAAGCVTTTTRAWLPSPRNLRHDVAGAQPVVARFLGAHCAARPAGAPALAGTAAFRVDVAPSGEATRAEAVTVTRDAGLDGILGTIAAQLALEPGPRARQVTVDIAYDCTPTPPRAALRVVPATR